MKVDQDVVISHQFVKSGQDIPKNGRPNINGSRMQEQNTNESPVSQSVSVCMCVD